MKRSNWIRLLTALSLMLVVLVPSFLPYPTLHTLTYLVFGSLGALLLLFDLRQAATTENRLLNIVILVLMGVFITIQMTLA